MMSSAAERTRRADEKLYTIGTVARLTGVGSITLRAWERRYGLLRPVRKASGHRLYTRHHIDQINRISTLTRQGVRVSQIRPEMLESRDATRDAPESAPWQRYLDSMISAVIAFDEERLEETYHSALSLYPIDTVTRRLLTPLLVELGLRWASGEGSIAEEHFCSFYLRNKLGARYHHRPRVSHGPQLLLAGLPGEHHEIGLLLFALAAQEAGYRILPLGSNMPLAELASIARRKSCQAIVLSGALEPDEVTLQRDLPGLVAASGVPVLVGGLASVYACDAINRAGAATLGREIGTGMLRLAELLA
jgi:DNA-binding transcriptional MerR regulator/methylmalonyl-CoA mutase cobalamin-binding subunit